MNRGFRAKRDVAIHLRHAVLRERIPIDSQIAAHKEEIASVKAAEGSN